MTRQTPFLLVAAGAVVGVAGATAFLIESSHQAHDQACRQDTEAATQAHPAGTHGAQPPDDTRARKPQQCDHERAPWRHSSGGAAFFSSSAYRSNTDDDDAPRGGALGGEAESAGHAGFGASAASHGGGGE